jgi:hypothetical protein
VITAFRGRRSWRWSGWFKHVQKKIKRELEVIEDLIKAKKIAIDEHKEYQKYTKQQETVL